MNFQTIVSPPDTHTHTHIHLNTNMFLNTFPGIMNIFNWRIRSFRKIRFPFFDMLRLFGSSMAFCIFMLRATQANYVYVHIYVCIYLFRYLLICIYSSNIMTVKVWLVVGCGGQRIAPVSRVLHSPAPSRVELKNHASR